MKTLLKTIPATLSLLALKLKAFAYTIPSEYRPENMPLGFTSETSAGEEAISGIIVLLQVLEGSLLYFAAPIAVIVIAYAGLQMIMAGNADGYTTGKKTISWGLLGLLVIILSYSIVRIAITLLLEFAE
ncbi:MAG: hypothetical protein RBS56_02715 [Candidatus Gracilibacteria bacterium]|jgi:hypothetical protein|nr:hypothetical protein [Candidatus Gracilibacteria bacterium]